MIFDVRRAREDELDDIMQADRVCFPDDRRPETGLYVRWWIAEINGIMAGYGAARVACTTPDSIYLSRAGVLPWARRRGLQRQLIRVREAWGRSRGYHWCVTDSNGAASATNLIRSGYLPWEPDDIWGLDEATYWWKRIAS